MAFVKFSVERGNKLPDQVHEGSWNWHHRGRGCIQWMTSATQPKSIIKHLTAVR